MHDKALGLHDKPEHARDLEHGGDVARTTKLPMCTAHTIARIMGATRTLSR